MGMNEVYRNVIRGFNDVVITCCNPAGAAMSLEGSRDFIEKKLRIDADFYRPLFIKHIESYI